MNYLLRIFKAILPSTPAETAIMAVAVPLLVVFGYTAMHRERPVVTNYMDPIYPKTIERGTYFFLIFDVSYGETCEIDATRVIRGKDGVEYVALEERKFLQAGERWKGPVRIPVGPEIPFGPAVIRSDFVYKCDLWDRYINARKSRGRERVVEIVPPVSADSSN